MYLISTLILPFYQHLRINLPRVIFLLDLPIKILKAIISPILSTCVVHRYFLYLITWTIKENGTNYDVPYCEVFSISNVHPSFIPNIWSQIPLVCVPPLIKETFHRPTIQLVIFLFYKLQSSQAISHGQRGMTLIRWFHNILSGFLANDHLLWVPRQSNL
jgi:hypothetical protein